MKRINIALTCLIGLMSFTGCSGVKENKTVKESSEKTPVPTSVTEKVILPSQLVPVDDSYKTVSDHPGTLQYSDYQTKDYDGDQREMTKHLLLYLPYGYDSSDPETRYDIVYIMHGRDDSPESILGTPDQPSETKNVLDHLIQNKDMKPVIMAAVDYYPDNRQVFKGDGDASMTKSFGQELKNDIMPQLESQVHTYASSADDAGFRNSRDHRMFAGFSMGGVTTWYRMMDSMSYFRYFMPMSGSLYWGSEVVSEKQNGDTWIPEALRQNISAQGYGKDDFFVFTVVGSEDTDFAYPTVNQQISLMKNMNDLFDFDSPDQKVNAGYLIGNQEPHDYSAVEMYLYNLLPVFSKMMNEKE